MTRRANIIRELQPVVDKLHGYGGVDGTCPVCGEITPIYPDSVEGSGRATDCVYCCNPLQWKDKGIIVWKQRMEELVPVR